LFAHVVLKLGLTDRRFLTSCVSFLWFANF
jgi:hypothetical protein